jgi:hypothetical protein
MTCFKFGWEAVSVKRGEGAYRAELLGQGHVYTHIYFIAKDLH